MNHTSKRTRRLSACVAAALMGAATILAATATAGTTACAICGKNLIKNPGADGGLGSHGRRRERRGARLDECRRRVRRSLVRLPERLVLGEIDRARRTGARTTSSAGTTRCGGRGAGNDRKADDQAARRRGRQDGDAQRLARQLRQEPTQVRAQFEDAAGTLLSTVKIGPDTTIAGTNMTARSRSAKVPAGTKQVTIVVTFAGGGANYKLAGADALSLILR